MVGSERDIVTTGAIVITAAIGTDASQRDEPIQALHWREILRMSAVVDDAQEWPVRQVGSITRLGYATRALARVAGDLWQGQSESIDQPASPGLR
jgi:hypothetical protein